MEQKNLPIVSVVIPCYNHEQFVQDSIQSVIDQTYQNIELIIIDDGSEDNSVEIIKKLIPVCEKRFTRFEFRVHENKGLSATLNEALLWCEGEYYSGLASDDIMLRDKIEMQVQILNKNTQYVAVFGAVELIDSENNKIREIRQTEHVFEFKDLIYTDRFLPAPTQLIRLQSLKNIGGFVSGMIIEDWYIYLKLLEDGSKIFYHDVIYAKYRSHSSNTYSNTYKMALGRLQVVNEFKEYESFKKAYIKVCWDNILETLRSDFWLSVYVLFNRVSYKMKLILRKSIKKI